MVDHWWEQARSKLNAKTVALIEDFMKQGLQEKNLHPRRLAQIAYGTDFKDEVISIDIMIADTTRHQTMTAPLGRSNTADSNRPTR